MSISMTTSGVERLVDTSPSSETHLYGNKSTPMMSDESQSQESSVDVIEVSTSEENKLDTVKTKSDPNIPDRATTSSGKDREESDDEDFLRVRAKVRDLKGKAKGILQIQALKAEYMELEQMLGGQIDPNDSEHRNQTAQQTTDALTSVGLGNRYRDESFDQLYQWMPEKYRRQTAWTSYDEIQATAKTTALKTKPSPFLDGYIQPQQDGDDLSYEFTRRKLQARYSYEREMEYLYAVQERYDAMRAETLKREQQGQLTEKKDNCEPKESPITESLRKDEPETPRDLEEDNAPSEKNDLKTTHELRSPQLETGSKAIDEEKSPELEVHYFEWQVFNSILNRDVFVVEVLVGEPMIQVAYDVMGIAVNRRPVDKSEDASKDRKGNPKGSARGQGPLPERIRISSRFLSDILEELLGEDYDYGNHEIIMSRPFKTLSYYENKLRAWYEGLAKKFHVRIGDCEPDEAHSESEDGPEAKEEWDKLPDPAGALQHLGCLLEFIDTEIKTKVENYSKENFQHASFADMWHLFKPGDEVVDQQNRQAYRVLSVTSPGHKAVDPWSRFKSRSDNDDSEELEPMFIRCVYVDFDGKLLGPVVETFEIDAFDGEKSIYSLPIKPLRFTKIDGLRQILIERGKKFVGMTSVKHMHCSGVTLDTRDEVDGQVVVDFAEALSVPENKSWRPDIEDLVGDVPESSPYPACYGECCNRGSVFDDNFVDDKRNEDFMSTLNPQGRSELPSILIHPRNLEELARDGNAPTDDEYLIMSNRVFGFILRSRKWASIDLADLVDVQVERGDAEHGQETPFDKLVLPPGHKQMIQSLIAQHFRDKESGKGRNEQVDFVRGKGKGLILLLHGAPGVGKTSTAECIADLFQKPLFQITCGDLGVTAKDVETTLETNFSLANRWGCILLLDEADVFLAARSLTDFTRNGLVAVFLRVLEYYAGILFLTTNRVGDFDEAFASRIHISLYYPPLTLDSTIKVFELNFAMILERFKRKGRKIHIDTNILPFATQHYNTHQKARWNGRQVRNACQTALALAEFEAQGGNHDAVVDSSAEVRLQVKHFETVTNAYLEFTHYLKDIFGSFADQRAEEQNLRAPHSASGPPNPLLSHYVNGRQAASYNQAPPTSRGYSQYPAPVYQQPPYTQQFTPGTMYNGQGNPGNPQSMPQQPAHVWSTMSIPNMTLPSIGVPNVNMPNVNMPNYNLPSITVGASGSLDAAGVPQQANMAPGAPGYIQNPPAVPPHDYQMPPGGN